MAEEDDVPETPVLPVRTRIDEPKLLDEASEQAQRVLRRAREAPTMPSVGRSHVSICVDQRFIWYRVAKVATRSIYSHLKRHVRLECDHAHDVLLPLNRYTDFFKFGFVRNPWDRVVSCWSSKVARANRLNGVDEATWHRIRPFPAFVRWLADQDLEAGDLHYRQQCRLIDLSVVDFVGRFESFAADYAAVCRRLDIPLDGLAHENASGRADHSPSDGGIGAYREFYTDALAEAVGRLYRKDVQIFGYRY